MNGTVKNNKACCRPCKAGGGGSRLRFDEHPAIWAAIARVRKRNYFFSCFNLSGRVRCLLFDLDYFTL